MAPNKKLSDIFQSVTSKPTKRDSGPKTSASLSIFVREDEIFTGEEAVFTLKFPTMKKLQSYFPSEGLAKHEFFIKTDIYKPSNTRIIVRIVHPDTKKILVMYAKISRQGRHLTKTEQKGIFYKIIRLDPEQSKMVYNFIA